MQLMGWGNKKTVGFQNWNKRSKLEVCYCLFFVLFFLFLVEPSDPSVQQGPGSNVPKSWQCCANNHAGLTDMIIGTRLAEYRRHFPLYPAQRPWWSRSHHWPVLTRLQIGLTKHRTKKSSFFFKKKTLSERMFKAWLNFSFCGCACVVGTALKRLHLAEGHLHSLPVMQVTEPN